MIENFKEGFNKFSEKLENMNDEDFFGELEDCGINLEVKNKMKKSAKQIEEQINRSNYQYKVKIKKEDEDKIPILKKETIKKCKEILEKYKDIKTIIGVPSGDGEEFCFDVPEEEYKKIMCKRMGKGFTERIEEWKNSNKSFIYKKLYIIYGIPKVPIWNKKYKNPTHLLKVKYNDYGIISIEETDIPVEKIN